jgi:osmotically inducible lipoprotein OsmB
MGGVTNAYSSHRQRCLDFPHRPVPGALHEEIIMKSLRVCMGLAIAFALTGCGTLTGAVLGGAAGHAIGGNTSSTVAGAVVGGVIGNRM